MALTSQQVNDKVKREMKMYGMCDFDIRREYMESATAQLAGGNMMVVASILSDCQEMLLSLPTMDEQDNTQKESIRQQLNVAKFILSEQMKVERTRVALAE